MEILIPVKVVLILKWDPGLRWQLDLLLDFESVTQNQFCWLPFMLPVFALPYILYDITREVYQLVMPGSMFQPISVKKNLVQRFF